MYVHCFVVFVGIDLLLVVFIAYRIRGIYDAFGIKSELKYGLLTSIGLLLVVVGRDRWYTNNIYRLLWWICTQLYIYTICSMKVYRSYSYPKHFMALKNIDSNELSRTMENLNSIERYVFEKNLRVFIELYTM